MRILPLASDSLGVRSLATFVEFSDGSSLLIDGGVRLGPKRYGLAPTLLETRVLSRYERLITDCMKRADRIVISHYHYDHYFPDSMEYSGKTILAKDPIREVNRSQQIRGTLFHELWRDQATIEIADGREFTFDDIMITFSDPVPHGEDDSRLGTVLMTRIDDQTTGETLLHTSDIQGPVSTRTADSIESADPTHLILDGAPTYLQEWHDPLILGKVEENLTGILDAVNGTIIMDHHHLRDSEWRSFFRDAYARDRTMNFAEFQGGKPVMLESMRREIWRNEHGKG